MTLRRSTMRPQPRVDHRSEPGYAEWKKPVYGKCSACDFEGRLVRHHVVHAQHVRLVNPALVYDLRNAMPLGMHCRCHAAHHGGASRLSVAILPAAAVEFAIEVLGTHGWDLYAARYYRPLDGEHAGSPTTETQAEPPGEAHNQSPTP